MTSETNKTVDGLKSNDFTSSLLRFRARRVLVIPQVFVSLGKLLRTKSENSMQDRGRIRRGDVGAEIDS